MQNYPDVKRYVEQAWLPLASIALVARKSSDD